MSPVNHLRNAAMALSLVIAAPLSLSAASAQTQRSAPPPTAVFSYDGFEQPQLVRALIERDTAGLMRFRVGLLIEEHGIPQGLIHYLQNFNAEISQLFLCPTLMPAGLDPTIQRFAARQAMDPQALTGILGGLGQLLMGMVDSPAGRGPASFDPRRVADPILDGQTLSDTIKDQGRRDARIFYQSTGGCQGPEADAMAQGARVLMRYLQGSR